LTYIGYTINCLIVGCNTTKRGDAMWPIDISNLIDVFNQYFNENII